MRTIVVGAGAAGLWCAPHAADRGPVTLIAPGVVRHSATTWAQGGIAAAMGTDDGPDRHAADTFAAGDGLCDLEAVGVLTRQAPRIVAELQRLGMAFDPGGPALEGAHSVRRVLHAGGDASGLALHAFLVARVKDDDRIARVDARVTGIVVEDDRAVGVVTGGGAELGADRVILATGGACGIYARRTGPETSVGEGLAMAWEAGASLADLEFVQFHPTALDVPGRPSRLLTEALRGEGAFLVDAHGGRFMERFHPLADLAPRDVVARAVLRVREETGEPVYLDARAIPDVAERFPVAATSCRLANLDIASEPVPVAPAAHYFTGGVRTDTWGRTSVPGLFAAGECASTGVHGANRLASNSLAEALVFGERAAIADEAPMEACTEERIEPLDGDPPRRGLPLEEVRHLAGRHLAGRHLGALRTGDELAALVDRLSGVDEPDGSHAATLVAWLLVQAALRREESRGGQFREDFPERDDRWRVRQAVDRHGWSLVPVLHRTDA